MKACLATSHTSHSFCTS